MSSTNRFVCPVCESEFPNKGLLNAHKKKSHRRMFCDQCWSKINYMGHKCTYCGHTLCDDHRLPEQHDCPDFDRDGKSIVRYLRNKSQYSDGSEFSEVDEEHGNLSSPNGDVECPYCNLRFESRQDMKNHLKKADDDKHTSQTNSDSKNSSIEDSDGKDESKEKDEDIDILTCDKCGKEFEYANELSSHIRDNHDKSIDERKDMSPNKLFILILSTVLGLLPANYISNYTELPFFLLLFLSIVVMYLSGTFILYIKENLV